MKVLFLCPARRDRREMLRLPGIETTFHDYGTTALEDMLIAHRTADPIADPLAECAALVKRYRGKVDAVLSADDYPGSTIACIVARELGLPGPSPAANLTCQHKYVARQTQSRLVPEATPAFAIVDTGGPFHLPAGIALPAFVKPIKSFFSIGAQKLDAWAEIAPIRDWWHGRGDFFAPFDRLMQAFTPHGVGTRRLIVEQLLSGQQVTVEGYAARGTIQAYAIVDSVMFPGTNIFQRFEYPSSLAGDVQKRMADIACRTMQGIGFDDGLFNIEMMYDAELNTIHIIEINPRLASQFADLYEKVDGFSSYALALDIALGRAPRLSRRAGPYAMAASCVLRAFADHVIVGQPTPAEIDTLTQRYTGLRVEATGVVGEKLSDTMQDGQSFRYGLIHLGGRDRAEILTALADCERNLSYRLRAV